MGPIPPIGIIRAGVRVNIRVEVIEEEGQPYCLIHTLTGRITLGPKAWLTAVREEVRKLERIAKASGCAEMRIEGRDWSRILRPLNYVPWPQGDGFALRKVL